MLLKKLDPILSLLSLPIPYILRFLFLFCIRKKETLIVRPGGMGDLVLLTLAIKKQNLLFSNYFWLIERRSEQWAKYLDLNYSCYDQNPLLSLFLNIGRYSKIINTEQRFGLSQIYSLSCLAPGGKLTSFKTNRLAFMAQFKVNYDPLDAHELSEFSRITGKDIKLKLFDINESQSFYSVIWIAGNDSESRALKISDYVKLLNIDITTKIHIVSAPVDKDFAKELKQEIEKLEIEIHLFDGTFAEACDLLKNAKSLFTVDSAPVHIASYFSIKVFSIFTSGRIQKWHPLTMGSLIFNKPNLECAPCAIYGQLPICTNHYQCKEINYDRSISVDNLL